MCTNGTCQETRKSFRFKIPAASRRAVLAVKAIRPGWPQLLGFTAVGRPQNGLGQVILSYQLTMLRPNRKMIDAMAAINTEMAAKAKIGCPL